MTPYATSIRLGSDLRLDLFTSDLFRVRMATAAGGSPGPDRSDDMDMFRLHDDTATHAQPRLKIQDEVLVAPDPFAPELDIPFCCGRVDAWPAVSHRHQRQGALEVITTDRLQIQVDVQRRSATVWTADGARRLFPDDSPRFGFFQGQCAHFAVDYTISAASCFYDPAVGRYLRRTVAMREWYCLVGAGFPERFARLRDLIGPEPLLPQKLYGFIQTQHLWNNGNQTRFLALADRLRERRIPCDVLILDYEWGDGCDGKESFAWGSRSAWAQTYCQPLTPAQMLERLNRQHFAVMLITHSQPRSADLTQDPWFRSLAGKLTDGVAGVWQDRRWQDWQDHLVWLGLQDLRPGQRPWFMGNDDLYQLDGWHRNNARDGIMAVGSRRYPFHWTGDCDLTWTEFRFQVQAITGCQGSLRGISALASDATGRNWKLQARWNQFLDFSPIARSHTQKPWPEEDDPDLMGSEAFHRWFMTESTRNRTAEQDPAVASPAYLAETPVDWSGSPEASIRCHRRLRYRLLPYIYRYAHQAYAEGLPLCRPLLMAFPDDPACNRHQWPYQYLFGDWLLVAPVTADVPAMDIHLPAGETWVDYWDDREYPGGKTIRYDTRQVEKLPLFVRRGAILPLRPEADWIVPGPFADPLTLDCYPGASDTTFILHEDDGVSDAYQRGEVLRTPIRMLTSEPGRLRLEIGPAQGSCAGAPQARSWIARFHLPLGQTLSDLTVEGQALPVTTELVLPRLALNRMRVVEARIADGRGGGYIGTAMDNRQ